MGPIMAIRCFCVHELIPEFGSPHLKLGMGTQRVTGMIVGYDLVNNIDKFLPVDLRPT